MKITISKLPLLLMFVTIFSCHSSSKISSSVGDYKQMAIDESKRLTKDGWQVAPGSLSLENAVYESVLKSKERDESGNPKYFIADGNAVAQTYTAGQMQAQEVAKVQIASQIQTSVASIVEANIANEQLSTTEAASVTKVVQSSKSIVQAKLGYVQPLFIISRPVANSQVEVQAKMAYSYRNALDMYKATIKTELEKEATINSQKIDSLLKF